MKRLFLHLRLGPASWCICDDIPKMGVYQRTFCIGMCRGINENRAIRLGIIIRELVYNPEHRPVTNTKQLMIPQYPHPLAIWRTNIPMQKTGSFTH